MGCRVQFSTFHSVCDVVPVRKADTLSQLSGVKTVALESQYLINETVRKKTLKDVLFGETPQRPIGVLEHDMKRRGLFSKKCFVRLVLQRFDDDYISFC